MGLDGPSKTITVEPVPLPEKLPAPPQEEPAPAKPEKEPVGPKEEPVPA